VSLLFLDHFFSVEVIFAWAIFVSCIFNVVIMHSCLFISKNNYSYGGKYEKLLFLANMQIISLNMHNTKMAQTKIISMEKIGLGITEKLLVPKFIEFLLEYPCLGIITTV